MPSTRREFLAATGTAALAGIAGCGGDSDYDRAAGVASDATDWPTLGHGPNHTAYAPNARGPTAEPSVAWEHDVGLSVGHPVVAGDSVLVPANYEIRCYALADGAPRWTYGPEALGWTTPTVHGDRVFVSADHDGVHVLDLASGERVRKLDVPGFVSAAPTVDRRGRRVYVGSDRGRVHAFPLVDDADPWTTDLFGEFRVPVTPTPYGVFAATSGGEVYCLDADDGTGQWRTKLPGVLTAPPVAVTGGVFVPCMNGHIYHLRGERAGGVEWRSKRGGFGVDLLAVAAGTVFGAHHDSVVAVDADTGREEWRANVGGQAGRAVAVAGDTLYVGSFGGEVHALELDGPSGVGPLRFGGRKWSKSLPGGAGEGAAVADGTLVTMGEGGDQTPSRVVALR